MPETFQKTRSCYGRIHNLLLGVIAIGGTFVHVSHAHSDPKLIIGVAGFPCGLNDFAKTQCAGFEAGAKELPAGITFELKTGLDYGDQTALNNLIETSQQLNPAGLIVFASGPAAQVPVLRRACAAGIKIIIVDSPVVGLNECQTAYVGTDHHRLGVILGEWLVSHPPSSKEVGIVTFAPGQDSSADARVDGFKSTVEAGGYRVVATVTTDLSLEKTRTQVTNMLTAHPKLGTVMSMNDQIGYGVAQAIDNPAVTQLSIDGALDSVKRILADDLSANAAQDPYSVAKLAVLSMARAIQGEDIPAEVYAKTLVVDKSNAEAYIAAGGLHGLPDE